MPSGYHVPGHRHPGVGGASRSAFTVARSAFASRHFGRPETAVARCLPWSIVMRTPSDAILVLNAGSSSIKLAAFAQRAGELALELRGEIQGLYTTPRFQAHDQTGRVVAEKSWGGARLGHEGAVDYLGDFLPRHLAQYRLVGVGHRVPSV
jgi:hypothetical protein